MQYTRGMSFKFVSTIVLALISLGSLVFCIFYWNRHKEDIIIQVAEMMERIALPYRMAQLRALPPDESLFIPLRDIRLRDVADTWGEARSEGRVHEGVDIFAERGTPVFAAVPGYVMRVGISERGGNYVFTIGAGGRRYYYAHLDAVALSIDVGEAVTPDTVLGFVGNTGNASGTPPHLHFGMYDRGPQNPYSLLEERE